MCISQQIASTIMAIHVAMAAFEHEFGRISLSDVNLLNADIGEDGKVNGVTFENAFTGKTYHVLVNGQQQTIEEIVA